MRISRGLTAAGLIVGAASLQAALAEAQSPLESLKAQQRGRRQQQQEQQQEQAQPATAGQLSREETAVVRPLYDAVHAQDWASANAALPAAQAGVQTPYGRYIVGQLILEIGRGTQNMQLQQQAVDAMLASGGAPADVVPQLLAAQAGFALQAHNYAGAEAPLTRLVELSPNDVDRIGQLAAVKIQLNKRPEALALYRRAIQLGEANGGHAPEAVYRQSLAIAYEARTAAPALELARTLITHYPTPENWRSALGVYRDLAGESGGELDIGRLMRVAGVLTSERDYYVYAEAANRAGLPGEVKSVLDEGFSRNIFQAAAPQARQLLTAATAQVGEDRASLARLRTQAMAAAEGRVARRTGDAFYGYGQYAEAAELYRAALQKGGEDAGMVNVRLGSALAMAGRRAEAEAAFRAVTAGDRAELARFWLLWLSTHPA